MRNDKFEDKLYDEILVDCKDDYEQNMSWFYYVQDELKFPFNAEIILKTINKGKETIKVKVVNLPAGDLNFDRNFDIKVDIELGNYLVEIPLSKLEKIEGSEEIIEIIEIWKYWVKKIS